MDIAGTIIALVIVLFYTFATFHLLVAPKREHDAMQLRRIYGTTYRAKVLMFVGALTGWLAVGIYVGFLLF